MLNTIHQTILRRLAKQAAKVRKWPSDVSPRVCKMIEFRESKTREYIVTFNGGVKYGVSTGNNDWVVHPEEMDCSCGLWKLSGVPCVHAVCVFMRQNKDSRLFVHTTYNKATQTSIYSHFLEPIRGPVFWPKMSNLPPILPPPIRVLPGRPKKARTLDVHEKANKKKGKGKGNGKGKGKGKQKSTTEFKSTRKGSIMHCSLCNGAGHNKSRCPLKNQPTQQAPTTDDMQNTRGRKRRSGESSSQPVDQTQPTSSRKSKKSKR